MSDRRNRGPALHLDFAEEGPDRRRSTYDDGSRGGVDGPLRLIYASDPSDPDSGRSTPLACDDARQVAHIPASDRR